jgi:predicted Zn finger-like uncharacterized protein
MSIVTQCPSCGTKFRVTPPQLQAQHGMVRCGRCAQVFDGFKTLATLPETTQPDALPPDTPSMEAPPASPPAVEVTLPELVHEDAQPPTEEAPHLPPPAVVAEPVRADVPSVASEPPPFMQSDFDAPVPRRRSSGWTFGVVLMLAGLTAQGAYFYRSDLAAGLPEARPYLNKMCEFLQCTVPLPQRPELINIVGSELRSDPANPGRITVTASLRSQATTVVGYPAFDVGLTDNNERMLARRIFLPAEYLSAGKDPRTGIAPNAEADIRVDLETGDLGATGFRLYLIAAPAR